MNLKQLEMTWKIMNYKFLYLILIISYLEGYNTKHNYTRTYKSY